MTTRRVQWGSGGGIGDAIKILLLLSGIGFLAQLIWDPAVTRNLGLIPIEAWSRLRLWQFVTYLFLHGGWLHLLFNLYALWTFGTELEHDWGFGPFLRFYLVCGAGAGVLHTLITPHSPIPTIGASGAVSGVLAAYAMSFPERELQLLLFFVIPVRMKAKVLALGLALISLVLGVLGSPDGVAHFAHLGGLLVGAVYFQIARRQFAPIRWIGEWRRRRRFRLAVRARQESETFEESVNAVLDKANRVGFDALSATDKKILKKASGKLGGTNRRKNP